jgi:hypothetical protein
MIFMVLIRIFIVVSKVVCSLLHLFLHSILVLVRIYTRKSWDNNLMSLIGLLSTTLVFTFHTCACLVAYVVLALW